MPRERVATACGELAFTSLTDSLNE